MSVIAVCRAIDLDHRNKAMQFLYVKLTFSLFYCLIFCILLTGAHGDKRYVFLVNTCAFYVAAASKRRALLTPANRRIFFADAARGLIMFWHDFGRGGGARAIVMFVIGGMEGMVSI